MNLVSFLNSSLNFDSYLFNWCEYIRKYVPNINAVILFSSYDVFCSLSFFFFCNLYISCCRSLNFPNFFLFGQMTKYIFEHHNCIIFKVNNGKQLYT